MVETPLVRVELIDGHIGWGESNTPIAPKSSASCSTQRSRRWSSAANSPIPTALWDFVYDSQRGRGVNSGYWMDALAALDIAIWDAIGKREDVPVATLLDENYRTNIPVYLSGLRRATVEERVTQAKTIADQGILGAKIFQSGDIQAALQELDALMRGAPNIEQWMVDTLWMCTLEDAIAAKREFGDRNLRFFECPLQPEDLAGHRTLHQAEGSPIAIGEHFRTTYQLIDWLKPRTRIRHLPARHRPNQHQRFHPPARPLIRRQHPRHPPHGQRRLRVPSRNAPMRRRLVARTPPRVPRRPLQPPPRRLRHRMDPPRRRFHLPDRPGIGVTIDEDGIEPHIVSKP